VGYNKMHVSGSIFQVERSGIFFLVIFIFFISDAFSQAPLSVTRISDEINFDGIPDEEVWKSVQSLPMIMFMPVFGNEPTETSIIKIAYDDEYFYISGILDYKDPRDLRAIGKKRDFSSPTTDWLGIILDTFNDKENAVAFWTNPNGLRMDATVKNDLADPNSDINSSWNTFWDVKSLINEHGWSAEFRIPFSSLRFQVKEDITIMGITIIRYSPAKSEMSTFPAVPPNFYSAYWKPSVTTVIEFAGLKPRKPVYVAPYITGGLGQVNEINQDGTGYEMTSTLKYDAGVDVKYSIANNLTLDLTVNTDFAQVEADDQKINLTRYSLYFPEKRIFFQEKNDVFDFSFLSGNNLFYSRRIGLYEGYPVRIYGGIRMTGRIDKWDIGILNMQTAKYEENPGENFGVFRTKRSLFNQNSYAGGMLTTRLGMNGSYNIAYGLDGQFRVTGDEYLTIRWAQTFENDSLNKFFDISPSRFMINWEHRNQKGFGYDFLYTWSGDRFNPGIGFELKDNYQGARSILQYGWFPEGDKSIRYHKIALSAAGLWNTATGMHETTTSALTWYWEAKKGSWAQLDAFWSLEVLPDTLRLGIGQAYVPTGKYPFAYLTYQYSTSYSHALSATLTGEAGKFYDGWKLSFSASPNLNIGTGITLGLTYYLDYVTFSSRSMKFANHIMGFKGLMTLTTKTSLSAFIQYNTAVDKILTNIRFRYNPREGNDFYLVYDEGLNTSLTREIPSLPFSSGRTILLKYTYTFRF
jgi:hypothetical protein